MGAAMTRSSSTRTPRHRIDLRKIGGVIVTAADAAQVYPVQDLVWAGLGHGLRPNTSWRCPLSRTAGVISVIRFFSRPLICSSCAGSAEEEPAVDAQLLSGEGRRAIRYQESDGSRGVLRRQTALERLTVHHVGKLGGLVDGAWSLG